MNEKIIEALKKLDPKTDSHWNQDGQVNLAAFKFMMGGEAVTREDIDAVAPNFRRDNLVIGAGEETTTEPTSGAGTAGAAGTTDKPVATATGADRQDQSGLQAAEAKGIDTSVLEPVKTVEGTYDPDADPSIVHNDNGGLDRVGPLTALDGDSSAGQPGTGTLEVLMGDSPEKKLSELTVNLKITLEDSLKGLLGLVEEKKAVSSLSDEELAQLRSMVPELRGKAMQVEDQLRQIVDTHIKYLDSVITESESRRPTETLQQTLNSYHETLKGSDQPVDAARVRARQVQPLMK